MSIANTDDGNSLFTRDIIDAVRERCIEGILATLEYNIFAFGPPDVFKLPELFGRSIKQWNFRDFHNEMKEVLATKDVEYRASFATCWKDNLMAIVPVDADPCP